MGAVIIWVGVIFFSSTNLAQHWAEQAYSLFTWQLTAPHPAHGLPYLLVDKGFHVTLFSIFALLLCQAIPANPRRALLVVLSGAIVGCCSEYLQNFFPGRDPAIRDVFINIGGTMLGVLLHWRFTLKREAVPRASTSL